MNLSKYLEHYLLRRPHLCLRRLKVVHRLVVVAESEYWLVVAAVVVVVVAVVLIVVVNFVVVVDVAVFDVAYVAAEIHGQPTTIVAQQY